MQNQEIQTLLELAIKGFTLRENRSVYRTLIREGLDIGSPDSEFRLKSETNFTGTIYRVTDRKGFPVAEAKWERPLTHLFHRLLRRENFAQSDEQILEALLTFANVARVKVIVTFRTNTGAIDSMPIDGRVLDLAEELHWELLNWVLV